jgi:hypothetical protein
MPYFVVSLVVQLVLVVHILKTGRNMTWVFIVLLFPLIGSLAYVIVELLPELTNSPTAHRARRKLATVVNPDKGLHEASRSLAVADTVQNAMALAEECLAKGRHDEARQLYEKCLRGVHADDPQLLLGLAQSEFGLGDFGGTVRTLDRLKQRNPGHTSAEGHLLYARAQEQLGNTDAAIHEYQALLGYYAGPEPACRLGSILKARGHKQEARALFGKVIHESRIAGRHYNTLHKEWVDWAQREHPT